GTAVLACLAGLLCLLAVGCGGDQKDPYGIGQMVPESGKVTYPKKLPKDATVCVAYVPEASKPRSANLSPSGIVDDQGNFTLKTGTKPGAPLGKYKVRVTATVPGDPKDPYAVPRSLIKENYSDAKMTPLSIEVKENAPAGSYD